MSIEKILKDNNAAKVENSGNKVTVYVPKSANAAVVIDKCSKFFTDVFGNYYSQIGEIKHYNSGDEIQPNNCIVVCGYCNDEQLEKYKQSMIDMLREIQVEGMSFDINGEKFVI